MAQNRLKIEMKDAQGKPTGIGGKVATPDGAAIDSFFAAVQGVTQGLGLEGASYSLPTVLEVTAVPYDKTKGEARSQKWAIVALNSLGNKETHYIPAADFDLLPGASDADITAAPFADLVAKFESLFVDAAGGALKVVKIKKARN